MEKSNQLAKEEWNRNAEEFGLQKEWFGQVLIMGSGVEVEIVEINTNCRNNCAVVRPVGRENTYRVHRNFLATYFERYPLKK